MPGYTPAQHSRSPELLATFCMLSMINPLTSPPSVDPLLINMSHVSIVKPRLKKGKKADNDSPSLIFVDGKQFVVKESVQQIHDKCLK